MKIYNFNQFLVEHYGSKKVEGWELDFIRGLEGGDELADILEYDVTPSDSRIQELYDKYPDLLPEIQAKIDNSFFARI